MITFAQAWERQERLRHQSLLQQLKAEFSVKSNSSAYTPVEATSESSMSYVSAMPSTTQGRKIVHPKPRKVHQTR